MSTEAERMIASYQRSAFNADGWVVMYPACGADVGSPLFMNLGEHPDKWGGAKLNWCTVFETWDEASKAASKIPYIMKQPPHLRRILKVKIHQSYELLEEHPIGVLDALAEL